MEERRKSLQSLKPTKQKSWTLLDGTEKKPRKRRSASKKGRNLRDGSKLHQSAKSSSSGSNIKTVKKKKKHFAEEVDFRLQEIDTVRKVELSDVSIRALRLRVGEDITAEWPWVLVDKFIILDLLDWYEDYCDFYSIGHLVKNYPEPKILMGWIPSFLEKTNEYYIILSAEIKGQIEAMLEVYEEHLQQKIQLIMSRPPTKPWRSYGSEREVDELKEGVPHTRTLMEIELNYKFPLHQKTMFTMRLVEDAIDGYVELLPDPRGSYELVEKRTMDKCIQAQPEFASVAIQVHWVEKTNQWTQFPDEAYHPGREESMKCLAKLEGRKTRIFDERLLRSIEKELQNNRDFDFFHDDYAELKKMARANWCYNNPVDKIDLKQCMTFADAKITQKSIARDGSWYSFKSGLLAVCYSEYAFSDVRYQIRDLGNIGEGTETAIPALLWSYDRSLKPLLYFQTPREIVTLSFCPYKQNILVGGLKNGQIIVWTIGNRLHKGEKHQVETYRQKIIKYNLWNLCSWYKDVHDDCSIEPTYISRLKNSHSDMVTSLKWVQPYLVLGKSGHWKLRERASRTLNRLVFQSFSLDGTILYWDIKLEYPEEKVVQVVPVELQKERWRYHKNFIKPSFKVNLGSKEGSKRRPAPISAVIKVEPRFTYIPIANISDDYRVRTDYTLDHIPKLDDDIPRHFFISTTRGGFERVSWSTNYKIKKANIVDAECDKFVSVHDGPVTSCRVNPFFEKYILTVGGSTFAIWTEYSRYALLWRKAPNGLRYMSASWQAGRPSYFQAIRCDGNIEIWNLVKNPVIPVKIYNLGGDLMTNVIDAVGAFHAKKNTFAISDDLGACTIFQMATYGKEDEPDTLIEVKKMFERFERNKKIIWKWINKFENAYYDEQKSQVGRLVESINSYNRSYRSTDSGIGQKLKQVQKMHHTFLQMTKDEDTKANYKALLERKDLKLENLAVPFDCLYRQDVETKKLVAKYEQRVADKQKKVHTLENDILREDEIISKVHKEIEEGPIMIADKFYFIANYEDLETKMLTYISSHKFKLEADFLGTLHRERKNNLTARQNLMQLNNRTRIATKEGFSLDIPEEVEDPSYRKKVKFHTVHEPSSTSVTSFSTSTFSLAPKYTRLQHRES